MQMMPAICDPYRTAVSVPLWGEVFSIGFHFPERLGTGRFFVRIIRFLYAGYVDTQIQHMCISNRSCPELITRTLPHD